MATHTGHMKTLLNWRITLTALCGTLVLSACATTDGPPPPTRPVITQPQEPQPLPQIPVIETETPTPEEPEVEPETPALVARDGLTPPHMQGRDVKRLALLLPFSARSERLREEAGSMFKAAEMAIFSKQEADVVLIALDTGGTAQGAASATQAAITSGADVILGPVLARSVKASTQASQGSGIPIIAFSTDQTVAGNGTYLLSFPPEAEVKRIVEYAATTGVQRFAFVGPQSAYGNRVFNAYKQTVGIVGGALTASESYDGNDISVMQTPAKKLADQFKAHEARTRGQGRMAFEAVLLPEGGTALRSLAPLLPYYDIDPAEVQFLGTGLWHKKDTAREPALNGGIFAGPPEDARRQFQEAYDQQYGQDASQLASLAYDAVNIGAFVADGTPAGRRARTEDSAGFYGADGLIRFTRQGTPDRGLAVYQIRNGQFVVIDPAPTTSSGPS